MILAIGGGSSMDIAKGIGIIVENPEFEDVVSLEGVADAKKHAAFTIAVPATADTAAEVTIGYLVADPDKVRKFVCVDVSDIPGCCYCRSRYDGVYVCWLNGCYWHGCALPTPSKAIPLRGHGSFQTVLLERYRANFEEFATFG